MKKNKNKHVLIVARDEYNLLGTSVALKRAGYLVSESRKGKEAIQRVIESKLMDNLKDSILLIIDLDEAYSHQEALEILSFFEDKGIKVNLLKRLPPDRKSDTEGLLENYPVNFMVEPFRPRELVRKVRKILG